MKSIPASNYTVRPFVTHKTQVYELVFGGSNPPHVSIDVAVQPPQNNWTWRYDNEPINTDGIWQTTLFASVHQLFDLTPINPGSTLFVVNIGQKTYGEGIRPGSITIENALSSVLLYDDGAGKICNSSTLQQVGVVNYLTGIIVVRASVGSQAINADGMQLTTGTAIEVTFDATVTIHEHQIICTMDSGEFNYSVNPSVGKPTMTNDIPFSLFGDDILSPFMTTVGLYNNDGELLAIAKFPNPLKRATHGQQTVIIRFDV